MASGASADTLFAILDAFLCDRLPPVFPASGSLDDGLDAGGSSAGSFDAQAFRTLHSLYTRSRPALNIDPHRDTAPTVVRQAVRRRQEEGDLSDLDDLAMMMRRPLVSYLSMRFDQARRCYHCGPKQLHVRIQPRRVVIAGIVDPVEGAIQGACGEPPPPRPSKIIIFMIPLGPPDNYVFLSTSTPTPPRHA